jgi:hypothetical protein
VTEWANVHAFHATAKKVEMIKGSQNIPFIVHWIAAS